MPCNVLSNAAPNRRESSANSSLPRIASWTAHSSIHSMCSPISNLSPAIFMMKSDEILWVCHRPAKHPKVVIFVANHQLLMVKCGDDLLADGSPISWGQAHVRKPGLPWLLRMPHMPLCETRKCLRRNMTQQQRLDHFEDFEFNKGCCPMVGQSTLKQHPWGFPKIGNPQKWLVSYYKWQLMHDWGYPPL